MPEAIKILRFFFKKNDKKMLNKIGLNQGQGIKDHQLIGALCWLFH